jgi:hypothetical protein
LVERLNGIQEVRGSNPLGSTILPERCNDAGSFSSTDGLIGGLHLLPWWAQTMFLHAAFYSLDDPTAGR